MKKTYKLLLTVFLAAVCLFITGADTAEAGYFDGLYYYYDYDGDGDSDAGFEVFYNSEENTVALSCIYCSSDKLVVPSVIDIREEDLWEDWYDWGSTEKESDEPAVVTELRRCQLNKKLTSVVIPPEVTVIEEDCFEYDIYYDDYDDYYDDYYEDDYYEDDYEDDYDYDYDDDYDYDYDDDYDDDHDEDDEENQKNPADFTVYCLPFSAAESFAAAEGYTCSYISDISSATVILSQWEYIYNGTRFEPEVIVTFGDKVLTRGSDYELIYYNNKNIGEAYVYVVGAGSFCSFLTQKFAITTVPAESVEIEEIETQYYNGWEIEPWLRMSYMENSLYYGEDYTYTISSNINPGTAEINISFLGMYSGTRSVNFTIAIEQMQYLSATAVSDSEVRLTWDSVPCGKYYVYRYSSKSKKYVYIGKTANTYYTDDGLSQLKTYKYAVKAVKNKKSCTALKKSATTLLKTPELTLITKNKAAQLKWTKNSKADGYQIYRCDNWSGEYKKVKTIRDNTVTTWTNKKLNNDYDYFFIIRAFKKSDSGTKYSNLSPEEYSGTSEARVNGAKLKSHTSFKVYNVQGAKSKLMYTITLNETDIKLLDKFKKKYFKEGMTRQEQLETTLDWINKNVTYALGSDWDKISGKTWVQAIFKYKLGQCAQYNGAMAAMMAYLGYDVKVVMGYRGTWNTNYWQHFWTEVKIEGTTYIVETGNYGRSGNWSYLIKRYSEASGYIRNQKNK